MEKLSKIIQKEQKEQQTGYFQDCLQIFIQLIQQCDEKTDALDLKVQVLALDQLLSILEKSGAVLLSKKEFQIIIQEQLLNILLKNCFNDEKPIYTLSFALVVSLVINFRDNLKQEIGTFLENVFIKLLDSNNSNFSHRQFSLKAIGKIFKFPRAVLELYVNYDCTLNEELIIENIINLLAKISQGKYLKPEYQNIINQPQELILKLLSFECMLDLVKSLSLFCEKCINQDEISILSPIKPDIEIEEYDLTVIVNNDSAFDKIESQRLKKSEIQKSIQKFNYKPQLGINYMIKTQLIQEDNLKEIAQFILNNQGIDQEKLGEFFSINQPFNQQLLSEFIDLIQFKNMNIQLALRELLSKFQLPKEAQQVDRIIEKFGEKYVIDNPGIYKSAAAAYTLSYALIILQTSLHNPSIQEKDRMTLQQFQKLISCINDGQDLPYEEIESMFQDIKNQQLAIHKDLATRKTLEEALTTSLQEKQELFKKETKEIIQKGQKKFKQQQDSQYMYVFSTQYVKPFLEMIWSPIFVSVTTAIEQSEDQIIIENCLQIVIYLIKLLGMFQLNIEKESFIIFLTKSTGLKPISFDQKVLSQKNIICIKYLIEATIECGNYIQNSWKIILQCISQLDYYQAIKQKTISDIDFFEIITQQNNIENQNSEIIQQNIDSSLIDHIFHHSDKLNSENILLFIQGLYELSIEEILSNNHPRTFSMKRIQEVTIFNMERVRLIWNQIWNILSNFFFLAGTHQNTEISEISIDLLKQLSLKFLLKQELSNYQFQKQFLDTFEQMYKGIKNNNLKQKELILAVLNNIIQICFYQLRSGWKTVFNIIIIVFQESIDKNQQVKINHLLLILLCSQILQKIMSEKLEYLIDVLQELMYVNIKLSDLNLKQNEINLQALKNIKTCLDFIFINSDIFDNSQIFQTHDHKKQTIYQECKNFLNNKLISTLIHLAKLINSEEQKLHKNSSEILFQILKDQKFSKETWKYIINDVIKYLFIQIYNSYYRKNNTQEVIYIQLKKKSQYVFQQINQIFALNQWVLIQNLYEILEIYKLAFINYNESLAKIASDSLRTILFDFGDQFDNQSWDQVINLINSIHENQNKDILNLKQQEKDFQLNIHELLQQKIGNKQYNIQINIQKNVTQCVIEIIFIDLINEIFNRFYHKLEFQHIEQLKFLLVKSHGYAQKFNNSIYLRYVLWQNGLMSDMVNLPGLLKHERESFRGIINIVYQQWRLFKDTIFLQQLIELITEYFKEFIFRHQQYHQYQNHTRIIEDQFKKYLNNLNLQEIERSIYSLQQNIIQTIFPLLEQIQPDQIQFNQLQKLVQTLVDISDQNYTDCAQCQTYKGNQNLETDQFNLQIKKIIHKYLIFLNDHI